jgi:ParB-like chromosome segregation protein Spo0J
MAESVTVPLARLKRDPRLWPRTRLSETRVKEFAEIYRADGKEAIDPIILAPIGPDGEYVVLDGWHRIEAALRAGLTHLLAIIQSVASEEEAYEVSVRLAAHGARPMTWTEKRAAIDRLLRANPSRSDLATAQIAGVSHPFVARRRALLDQTPTERPARKPASHLERHARAIFKAMHAMANLCGGWEILTQDGSVSAEIHSAMAAAARKESGAQASVWLEQLTDWAQRAHDGLSEVERNAAATE